MEKHFRSVLHNGMNHFLENLENALALLPNNPKPACTGFYLTDWDDEKKILTTEKIGEIPEEKEFKYLHFSTKKVTQTLLLGKQRSKDFENDDLEQYPGAVQIQSYCAGVSGHDSMIDEAISVLWLYEKYKRKISVLKKVNVWEELFENAKQFQQKKAQDNPWITIIAELLLKKNDTML